MDEPVDPTLLDDGDSDRLAAQLALDAAGIGAFDWDLSSGQLHWDERFSDILGLDGVHAVGRVDDLYARVHPDDAARVMALVDEAIATCGDVDALYRIVTPDGRTRHVASRGRVLCDPDGSANRLLGAAYDITGQLEGDASVLRVLEALPAGFLSLDPEWRFTYVNAQAEVLMRRHRDDLLGKTLWDVFPSTVDTVFEERFREAVAAQTAVTFDGPSPGSVDGWFEVRAWPSHAGMLVYFLEITERLRAEEDAQRSAARLGLLAQLGSELASAFDLSVVVERLPQMLVPTLADACIVTVLDAHGQPHDAGSWHTAPAARELLARYTQVRLPELTAIGPVDEVLTSGRHLLLDGASAIDMAPPGEATSLLARLAPAAAVAIPIRGRGRTLGLLTLFYEGRREPHEDDLRTAQDVADRTALSLDNARLYGQQRQVAEALQRSMLTAPPEPDHMEIAVRYLPAVQTAAVGGDWYDAFLQEDGATVLVIGDVVGHDIAAAATMGQLRSVLRGIATSHAYGPAALLERVDTSMAQLGLDTLATAVVAQVEQTPAEREGGLTRLRWSNAGHPPPLVIADDGEVLTLDSARSEVLLGVRPGTRRKESVATLRRGATVLLYTDGLIERRDADLDTGIERLRQALLELADRPLQELCDEVLGRLVQGRPSDDVALVAVRLHPEDTPRPGSDAGTARPTIPPPRGL